MNRYVSVYQQSWLNTISSIGVRTSHRADKARGLTRRAGAGGLELALARRGSARSVGQAPDFDISQDDEILAVCRRYDAQDHIASTSTRTNPMNLLMYMWIAMISRPNSG